ncbi:MAG: DUF1015 domain-containing protein [Myxococcota bacterium]
MAEIKPFRGVRYNAEKVGGDISKVLSPPYDIIDGEFQKALYERSPYNFVRIDFNTAADRPGEAAKRLNKWLEEGVLVRDEKPLIYVMEERYSPPGGGRMLARRGIFFALKLSEFGEGVVLPHERTLSAPKEERYNLMKATKAHLSPPFLLFDDSSGIAREAMEAVVGTAPLAVANFEGVDIKLWGSEEKQVVGKLQKALSGKALYIADGHHRYDTACRFRRENPANFEAINYGLIYACPFQDPGLVIFPTHRAVHGISDGMLANFEKVVSQDFEIAEIASYRGSVGNKVEELRKALEAAGETPAVAMITPEGKAWLLVVKKSALKSSPLLPPEPSLRSLDVAVLHELILAKGLGIDKEKLANKTNLDYLKDNIKTVREIEEGDKYQLGFFMRPTKLEQVLKVSDEGAVMPQKSTYFYPKIPTGLVFNLIDEHSI